jgi:RND family efflux transporter MFP subunit
MSDRPHSNSGFGSKTGSKTIVWRQRILWAFFGAVLAIGTLWALSALRFPSDAATADVTPQPEDSNRPFFPSHEEAPKSSTDECYIGVVVAREAVGIAAENPGLLRQVTVRVGDRVAQGQVLAILDTSDLRNQLKIEQANLSAAKARLNQENLAANRAKKEHLRRQEMTDLISKEELDSSRFELASAEAQLAAATSEVERAEATIQQLRNNLERSQIRAPFAGTVAQRYLDPGSRGNIGTLVIRLISQGGLLARFAVPPDQAESLETGQAIRIELADLDRAIGASIRHRSPEIDTAAQMVFIEADLDPTAENLSIPSGATAKVAILRAGKETPSCLQG